MYVTIKDIQLIWMPSYNYFTCFCSTSFSNSIAFSSVGSFVPSLPRKALDKPIAPYRERQVMVNMVKKLLDMEETTGNLLLIEEKLDQLKNSILSKAFRGKLGTNDPTEENAEIYRLSVCE